MIQLSQAQSYAFFRDLLVGHIPEPKAIQTLLALGQRGEKSSDILGAIKAIREQDAALNPQLKALGVKQTPSGTLDVCGTGGDGKGTLNVSTCVFFVAAACGVKVAKHGNRSVSSRCGSSDVLEALGVNILLDPLKMRHVFDRYGMSYLHAPLYHPSLKQIQKIRKKIKKRTIFNLLGPLLSPYRIDSQMIGVYSKQLFVPFAQVLTKLKRKNFTLLYSEDGLDEASVSAPTRVMTSFSGKKRQFRFLPKNLKIREYSSIPTGGNAKANAKRLVKILKNEASIVETDLVMLNAAFALFTAQKYKTLEECFEAVQRALYDGRAYHKLKQFVEHTS